MSYEVDCQGYTGQFGFKAPHKFLRDVPMYNGSHGICRDCLEWYRLELKADELYKSKVVEYLIKERIKEKGIEELCSGEKE